MCSNDRIQEIIKKIIWDSFNYYYERKRGEFEIEFPTYESKKNKLGEDFRKKFISNENAAQAFLAFFLDKPSQAKAETIRIFMKEQVGFYYEIFNEKILFSLKNSTFLGDSSGSLRKRRSNTVRVTNWPTRFQNPIEKAFTDMISRYTANISSSIC